MDHDAAIRNLEHRVSQIEQILPTLATRDDLRNLRVEVREEGARTRAHVDVVAESLRSDIRLLAEGLGALNERTERGFAEVKDDIRKLDRRVMRLEARRR